MFLGEMPSTGISPDVELGAVIYAELNAVLFSVFRNCIHSVTTMKQMKWLASLLWLGKHYFV